MENKQQPVVNICGSCILRDTFYYQGVYGKEKDGGYRINRYVNFFSPLALEQPPIPIYDRAAYEAFDLKPFGLTNFFRRCRRLDCERSFMEYLNDPADFLLVDTVMFRFQPYQMQVNGQKLICHGEHRPALEAMAKQGILPQLDAEVFSFESLSEEELRHRLQVYANQLKTLCPEERIILVETRHVFLQIDHANHVKSFSSTSQKIYRDGNRRMQKVFGILQELLPQAHLIPFPKQVLAETEHRLGVSGLHYTREYYEYCFQAVETIRKGLPRETEQQQKPPPASCNGRAMPSTSWSLSTASTRWAASTTATCHSNSLPRFFTRYSALILKTVTAFIPTSNDGKTKAAPTFLTGCRRN